MISIKDEMLGGKNINLNKTFSRCSYLIKKNIKTTIISRIKPDGNNSKENQQPQPPQQNHSTKLQNNNNSKLSESKISNNRDKAVKECKHKKTVFQCSHYNDTPEHLKRDYILNGYRVDFSIWLAIKSMFIPNHNDFANIQTHLMPIFYFCYLFYDIIVSPRSQSIYNLNTTIELVAFSVFLLSILAMLVCSTLYHTFSCHSFTLYCKLLVCDYLGIIFLIGSSFYPSLIYAFNHSTPLLMLYCGTITALCLSLIVFVMVPYFEHSNKLRNLLFVLTALFGIVPTLHVCLIFPADISLVYLYRLLMMFALYGGGLLIYIYKIPERWFPGVMDKIITSHAIWHLFVVAAPLYHLQTCLMANKMMASVEFL
ncbi:hypothetical protein DLAC_06359 [Tieghemostelium lacteum]|uniref:Hemolysin III n=1 Tax=Tieghemostelium lacteum TaxID=361077 RepID=A0A151ZEP0_TIELA|nr:hypothetical protein DLAC_06359 [Tieghemostelium lacteum]|eukprot:KYQ92389.1 hypothetical protein DLAC_06359 [Tieghemostelium lacteum]